MMTYIKLSAFGAAGVLLLIVLCVKRRHANRLLERASTMERDGIADAIEEDVDEHASKRAGGADDTWDESSRRDARVSPPTLCPLVPHHNRRRSEEDLLIELTQNWTFMSRSPRSSPTPA